MVQGKNILIGVSGGIAAYKACEVVSSLKKMGANVFVIMTKSAQQFVVPLTFETLSGNPVYTDMFTRQVMHEVEHISLAKKADLILIAPATANVIAKLALGIADDPLTTTVLASKAPLFVAPAMNTGMITNPAYLKNQATLVERGATIIESDSGILACGDVGKGRLADPKVIVDAVSHFFNKKNDYSGKTVLITAGATSEDIDGVRCLTNYSSGKTGAYLAKAAVARGAKVVLVLGSISTQAQAIINALKNTQIIKIKSTIDMLNAVKNNLINCDYIIKAAAPCDYKIEKKHDFKIKGDSIELKFVKNPDIAKEIGKIKGDKKLVIYSAESGVNNQQLINNSKNKLINKNADLCIANDVSMEGAGFDVDTNVITIIDKDKVTPYPMLPKSKLADIILDYIIEL